MNINELSEDNTAIEESMLKEEVAEKMAYLKAQKKKDITQKEQALSIWQVSDRAKKAVSKAMALISTEYGLFSSIPMICRGEECIYAKLYPELHGDVLEAGERCPVEIAFILSKYDAYVKELEIDRDDAVDMSILRDVIDYDIQIIRAENKMAMEGDFVKDVVVGVNDSGVPVTQEQISQAAEYKDRIQRKRNESLKLLNSTRKDKAGEKLSITMDPSSYAKSLLASVEEDYLEADFTELEIIPDITYEDIQKEREERQNADN